MASIVDLRNNKTYSLIVNSIGTYAKVTMADEEGFTNVTTGGPGGGTLSDNYTVELPGSPGDDLNVSFLIVG